MPGQRAKNKVPFGGFIDKKLHRKIIAAANKAGWRDNRFGYFLHLLTPIVERRYRNLKARQKAAGRHTVPRTNSHSPKSKKRA
jgi:hypothetical protein